MVWFHTPSLEHIDRIFKDVCDDDEPLLHKQFEDEFTKFCEKISVEEQGESSREDRCIENEPLFLDKRFENEFSKFSEKKFVEQKISSNHIESQICEDACMDDEPLFLEEFFKDECDHSSDKKS